MPYILWLSQTKGTSSPLVFIPHNLNHVSAFFYSCFVLPRLALAYLSLYLTPLVLLTYQHTWFCLFSIFLFFAPIIVCQTLVSTNLILTFPPPPGLVSHFLVFIHFFIFSSPFTLPDLLQPACFTCLFYLFVWPLFLCGCTGESDWRGECAVSPTTFLNSTVPGRREHARISQFFPGKAQ